MASQKSTAYLVEAYNLSQASENKIHDDAVAQKLGFSGGLVPGVEVYAYMTHPVVDRLGREWLERGAMEAKFIKPLYDGHVARVAATAENSELDLTLESDGVLCAMGNAHLPDRAATPELQSYLHRVPPAARPPADETSLAIGTWLSMVPIVLTRGIHDTYLRDVREANGLYAREGIAHPGWLLRACNSALRDNVVLAPWIHTASKVRNFGVLKVDDELSARGRVVANYERKGHKFVDLDVILIANQEAVIGQVFHTAAYRLRHLQERG